MRKCVILLFAGMCLAAAAAELPLTSDAWLDMNPLGGSFTGTSYACPLDGCQAFAVSKTAPAASNIVFSATLTPSDTIGGDFKTAAISLYEAPRRYWHLALAETPQGKPFIELNENRDGKWPGQGDLKVERNAVKGAWTRGGRYRLAISLDGAGCEGVVTDATGVEIFRRRYALRPGAVGCGRPVIKCSGVAVDYSETSAAWSDAVPDAVLPKTDAPAAVPPYATPKSVIAAAAVVRDAPAPLFAENADGAFAFGNGRVAFAGTVGGRLYVNGKGVAYATVREYSRGSTWWSSASEVVSAEGRVEDGLGVVDVTFGGRLRSGAPFRVQERFLLPAGRDFYYMEHVAVLNPGKKAFDVDEVFSRLLPVPELRKGTKEAPDSTVAPPKDGQPTPIPPTLWRPWQHGAWLCDGGDLVLALATPRACEMSIRFWDDPDRDSLHADAQCHFGRRTVAPGGAYAVEGRPFVAGAAVSGGLAAWTKVFAEIRKW